MIVKFWLVINKWRKIMNHNINQEDQLEILPIKSLIIFKMKLFNNYNHTNKNNLNNIQGIQKI